MTKPTVIPITEHPGITVLQPTPRRRPRGWARRARRVVYMLAWLEDAWRARGELTDWAIALLFAAGALAMIFLTARY